MPIEKVRILSILVLGASVMTWHYGWDYFLIQVGVVIPIWFPIPLDRVRKWPVWKLLGIFALVYFGYNFRYGDMLRGVFLLVMFCVAYELYGEMRKNAPIRLLSLVSFLIVIHMARLDVGLSLILAVLSYLLSAVFCLTAFQNGGPYQYKIWPIVKAYGALVIAFTGMSFATGLIVFWLMPRIPDQSLSSLPSLGGNTISGFSDRVTLTDIGSLKLSRKHVMDVTPMSGALHTPYLKGRVMDHYDRGVWSSNSYESYHDSDKDGVYAFTHPRGKVYDYKIDQDPLHGNNIFYFNTLVQLKGRLSPLKVEGDLKSLTILRKRPLAVTYYITSSQDKSPLKSRSLAAYLQMPSDHEYIGELATEALGEAISLDNSSRVQALLNYFAKTFTYSLDINNAGVKDPLKEFLMRKKEGHCELFASSMVLMLRSQQIPARLVTGFLVHERHPSGAFYYVTEADAHAWVEVFYNNAWHTLDPTPPSSSTPGFLETLSTYFNRIWRNMVISFDYETQATMFKTIKDKAVFLFRFLKDHPLFAGGVLLLLLWTWFSLRTDRFYLRRNSLARVLRRLEKALQEGLEPRLPREGIYDYVARLAMEPELKQSLVQFLDQYHYYRFGPPGKRSGPRLLMKDGQRLISRVKQVPREEPS